MGGVIMSVDVSITVNDQKARIKYSKLTKDFDKNVIKSVKRALLFLEGRIDKNLRQGKFGIKSREGGAGLAGSMESRVIGSGLSFVGRLEFKKVYARIQEKGGVINVSSRMAAFAWYKFSQTGRVMWKAIALLKGKQVRIPAHFFAKLTLQQEKKEILRIIKEGLVNG